VASPRTSPSRRARSAGSPIAFSWSTISTASLLGRAAWPRAGQQLQLPKPFIYLPRSSVAQNPITSRRKQQREGQPHDGSDHDKNQSQGPAMRQYHGIRVCNSLVQRRSGHGCARVASNQGVRRRGRQTPPPGEQVRPIRSRYPTRRCGSRSSS
jgi:hypothetical protein